MNTETYMNIANGFFLIGTTLLANQAFRNRNMLKDFNLTGSVLTFLGTVFMIMALMSLNASMSILFALPTMSFWGIVSIYSSKKK